jgi:uncharacterized protein (TIGR02588 family)
MNGETQHGSPKGDPPNPDRDGRSAAEWTTLAVSLAILVAVFGLVIWFEVRGTSNQPVFAIDVATGDIRHSGDSYYVDVEIRNDGDETVEGLVIEATLTSGTGEPEVGEISIDFLAGGERTTGTFIFGMDPGAGTLSVRPVSYKQP